MPYEPDKHHRRSIRLRGYDYAALGAYFVTICIQGRYCLFGDVADEAMLLNDVGAMVHAVWEALPQRFPSMILDRHVVMPNHTHAIITLSGLPVAGAQLGDIVGAFKSITTTAYMQCVRDLGWLPFDRRLWQRNYYEYIIRSDDDLANIRNYIEMNPARWSIDQLHPEAPQKK